MAKFSKQDYVSIARVIDEVHHRLWVEAGSADKAEQVHIDMTAVVTAFADMFAADNDRFDRQRFVMACEGERD